MCYVIIWLWLNMRDGKVDFACEDLMYTKIPNLMQTLEKIFKNKCDLIRIEKLFQRFHCQLYNKIWIYNK